MKPADKIEKLLNEMNLTADADRDRRNLALILQAQADKKQTSADPGPGIWSTLMHSKLLKPIAAMIIVAAVFFAIAISENFVKPAYAIEQTIEALRGVQNLRISMSNNGTTMDLLMLVNQQTGLADHIRMDVPETGDVTITIPGQTYIYKKQKNEVQFLPQELLRNDLNFKDVINSLVENTHAVKITHTYSNLAQQEVIVVTIIEQDKGIAGEFLIDPESTLPLYIGIENNNKQIDYMGPIEYNVFIPENAFDFVVPAGANVIDSRPEELKNEKVDKEPFRLDLAETAAAMRKANNVHGVFMDRQGRRVEAWGKIAPATGMVTVMRLEYEDGGLYIINKNQTYFEDDGIKGLKEGQYVRCGILFNDFISEASQQLLNNHMMTIEKEYSREFEKEVIYVDVKQPQIHLKAIVDIESKLPIYFSVPRVSYPNETLDHTEWIEYDVDLPEDFFDFETSPDVMILGKEWDTQFAKDPKYGLTYKDDETLQDVCEQIATAYLQAKIDRDIDTIKQLHSIYINRHGSTKMIEKTIITEEYQNGRIVEVLEFAPIYEHRPRQMMVPCKVIKEHKGQKQEMFSGVIVYLREHDGQKSGVITGFFPRLSEKQINNSQ